MEQERQLSQEYFEPRALVDRMRVLTYGQTVALVDDVEKWWKTR